MSTPALFFSAITVLLLCFSNRFTRISVLIRSFIEQELHFKSPEVQAQIQIFHKRLNLIKWMEVFGVGGLLAGVISMVFLFVQWDEFGLVFFIISIGCIFVSLILALIDVMISTQSLHILLETKVPKKRKLFGGSIKKKNV